MECTKVFRYFTSAFINKSISLAMNKNIRILIVEDNPADAELAEDTLKSAGLSLVSKIVETRDDYVHALSDFSPDLILSDYDLPLFNGADALDILKELRPDIPFILFTGAMGEERAIEILTGGATDYVMKNRLSRLAPAVERALNEVEEHRRRKAAEAERDLLFHELENRVRERTAELQAEILNREQIENNLQNYISKLKMMEQTVREREVRFSALFESAEDAIVVTDPIGDGRIIAVNPAACRLFGFTEQELQNLQHPRDSIIDTDDPRFELFMKQRNLKGHSKSELKYKRKDGSTFLGEISSSYYIENGRRRAVAIIRDITERKQAEEALHKALENYERQVRLFEGVASTTPDFVYVFDRRGRFVYANRRLLEVLGMELPYVIGKTCRELGYEQWHHDMHMREIAQVIKTKQPIKGEVPFKAPLTWIFGIYEYIFTPVTGRDGEVELIAGTTRDVTERKKAEEALRRSEELFRSIFESNVAALAIWDAQGNLLDANKNFSNLIGCTRGEIESGKVRWDAATPPELRQRDYDAIKELQTGKEIEPYEKEFIRRDGSRVPVIIGGTILPGTPNIGVAFAVDITKRKQAEKELAHQRELLQQIVDGIPVLLVQWDPRLKSFALNRHAQSVLGWTDSDANEGDFMSKVYPDKEYRAEIAEYMKSLKPGWHEWTATSKDGAGIPIDWSNVYLSDKTMIGIGVDVRERKRAEEALRKAKNELEDRVRERTALYVETNKSLLEEIARRKQAEEKLLAEIEERKRTENTLRSVQNKLRAMASEIVMADERSRQHLAADLHDTVIQTLGAAKLRSQLIQDEIPAGAQPTFGELQHLISESVSQARDLMTQMSPPVLNELGFIQALDWLAEQSSLRNGLKVSLKPAGGFENLKHEIKILLFQASRELLTNIVKHANASKARISLSSDRESVKITVSDNGKGFDGRVSFRTDKTGFGLFSIRERLKYLGGHLVVYSKPGRGSRVTMVAPRIEN